ncbi:hypothetical protein LUZ63_013507 [Rhynchospora breviuscula]|uniref:KIB1-4 beta-propeller domain-containing protein n=1 Tax=Rhynchospora breviuscula TaxID=2022672 RepID=A0A9Q0HK87_9POAL|nr:hypothetical protein LUZ63_013507 [Rhynchospora breviuscula]
MALCLPSKTGTPPMADDSMGLSRKRGRWDPPLLRLVGIQNAQAPPPGDHRLIGMICCSSNHGWLFLMEAESKEVFLLNPLTRAQIHLPPIADRGKPVEDDWADHNFSDRWVDPYLGVYAVRKVFFSADPTNQDCLITVFSPSSRGFFCCCVGDTSWTMVTNSPNLSEECMDATYYNGQFYLLYEDAIEIINSNNPEKRIVQRLELKLRDESKFFIEGKSGVYVIVRVFENLVDENDPAAHGTNEHTVRYRREKNELYKFQVQPLKLEKVTDTGSTIIFCNKGLPYLAFCSDDWDSLDGGSKYEVVTVLSLKLVVEPHYRILIRKLDDVKQWWCLMFASGHKIVNPHLCGLSQALFSCLSR